MPLTFNAVELCVVIINEKPWTSANKVCKALQYNTKTADIIKAFRSRENCTHKCQLTELAETKLAQGFEKIRYLHQ